MKQWNFRILFVVMKKAKNGRVETRRPNQKMMIAIQWTKMFGLQLFILGAKTFSLNIENYELFSLNIDRQKSSHSTINENFFLFYRQKRVFILQLFFLATTFFYFESYNFLLSKIVSTFFFSSSQLFVKLKARKFLKLDYWTCLLETFRILNFMSFQIVLSRKILSSSYFFFTLN